MCITYFKGGIPCTCVAIIGAVVPKASEHAGWSNDAAEPSQVCACLCRDMHRYYVQESLPSRYFDVKNTPSRLTSTAVRSKRRRFTVGDSPEPDSTAGIALGLLATNADPTGARQVLPSHRQPLLYLRTSPVPLMWPLTSPSRRAATLQVPHRAL